MTDIRREKILELASQNFTQHEIAAKVSCSQSLVSLDLQYLKCQAAESQK
jgi:predicted transcriptional regulator